MSREAWYSAEFWTEPWHGTPDTFMPPIEEEGEQDE